MKMKPVSLVIFLLILGFSWIVFVFSGFAQDTSVDNSIVPPPVEMQFNLGNMPYVGGEALLKLTVKALQDMHVDISCLLPAGLEFVRDEKMTIRPYEDRQGAHPERQMIYKEVIELWVGPLKAGEVKEFSFRVKIPDKEKYEFIACIDALAKWGSKEQALVIDL